MDKNITYSANVLYAMDSTLRETYHIHLQDIMKHCRTDCKVRIRNICISVYKKLTGEKITDVARVFERDRSTVYHALGYVEKHMADEKFRHDYDMFESIMREKLK